MSLEVRVVFLLLEALRLSLSVFSSRVARRRLPLFASFCALKSDDADFAFFSHGGTLSNFNLEIPE